MDFGIGDRRMKKKYIFLGILILLFSVSFIFKIIPVPLSNSQNNFSGFMFTSLYEQLSLKNFKAFFSGLSMFIVLFIGSYQVNKISKRKNGNCKQN